MAFIVYPVGDGRREDAFLKHNSEVEIIKRDYHVVSVRCIADGEVYPVDAEYVQEYPDSEIHMSPAAIAADLRIKNK